MEKEKTDDLREVCLVPSAPCRCRSGRGIPQYVIGWHKYANESSGVIKLTKENWNVTFKVSVKAAVDYKVSLKPASKFYQRDFLTLKVRARMFTKFSSKIEVSNSR